MQFANCSVFHIFHIPWRPLWEELWKAASLAEDPDEDTAGDNQKRAEQKPPADEFGSQKQSRENDAPERFGGDERGDHGDARAVVRLEEAYVREAEADACDHERSPAKRP